MKKKVYLTRDEHGYDIYETKPTLADYGWRSIADRAAIASSLCPDLSKQWFGLKNHLRKNTCIRGTFNVSFTPDKKKGK